MPAAKNIICAIFGHRYAGHMFVTTGKEVIAARLTAFPEQAKISKCARCGKAESETGYACAADTSRKVSPEEARRILRSARS